MCIFAFPRLFASHSQRPREVEIAQLVCPSLVAPRHFSLFCHNFSSSRSESFVDGGGGAAAVLSHHGAIIVGVWRISPDLNGVKCPLIVTARGGEGYATALLFLPHEVTI